MNGAWVSLGVPVSVRAPPRRPPHLWADAGVSLDWRRRCPGVLRFEDFPAQGVVPKPKVPGRSQLASWWRREATVSSSHESGAVEEIQPKTAGGVSSSPRETSPRIADPLEYWSCFVCTCRNSGTGYCVRCGEGWVSGESAEVVLPKSVLGAPPGFLTRKEELEAWLAPPHQSSAGEAEQLRNLERSMGWSPTAKEVASATVSSGEAQWAPGPSGRICAAAQTPPRSSGVKRTPARRLWQAPQGRSCTRGAHGTGPGPPLGCVGARRL